MPPKYGGLLTAERRKAIEDRITAKRLTDLFDDDNDGDLVGDDLVKLETTMADADDVVTGLLVKKGFTMEQLELLATDRQIVRAWANIAAQLAGERKPEWLDANGKGVYDAFGTRAREELRALARGDIRSVKEPEAGVTRAVSAGGDARVLEVCPDPRYPWDRGPGGF